MMDSSFQILGWEICIGQKCLG